MEPDLGGQEKGAVETVAGAGEQVAMEPDLGGQEKLRVSQEIKAFFENVAMEPDLGGQEKRRTHPRNQRAQRSRNGA